MAFPRRNPRVVGQGLARLTGQFQQPNCRAILAVYLQPFQELENTYYAILTARVLAKATVYAPPVTGLPSPDSTPPTANSVFDTIGALVGVNRGGQSDYDYRALIYLQIAVNRSTGRVTDWSRFAQILDPFCTSILYLDGDNADFLFQLTNLQQLNPILVAAQLGRAVPNGVYGLLAYTVWPTGNDFVWSSVYGGASPQGTWGSVYQSGLGGLFAACQAMSPFLP